MALTSQLPGCPRHPAQPVPEEPPGAGNLACDTSPRSLCTSMFENYCFGVWKRRPSTDSKESNHCIWFGQLKQKEIKNPEVSKWSLHPQQKRTKQGEKVTPTQQGWSGRPAPCWQGSVLIIQANIFWREDKNRLKRSSQMTEWRTVGLKVQNTLLIEPLLFPNTV